VDTAADDLREALRDLGGADVVYDPVGGEQFTAALRATRPEGRILAVGFASGTVPPVKLNHLLVKNIEVIGYWWGGYAQFAPARMAESLTTLLGWYEAGRLCPHVSAELPLAEVEAGYDLLRARRSTGKVVVRMGG
jgi:NADPH2:quinone reductase